MTIENLQAGSWRRVGTLDAAGINDLSQGECRDIAELLRKSADLRLLANDGRVLWHWNRSQEREENKPVP
jgi:hypothetical protein